MAGTKQSCKSDIKEQIREYLKREKEKKKEPPSQSAIYLEALRQVEEVVYEDYVGSIPFTNNFEKKMSQMPTSMDGNITLFVQANVDATNCAFLVLSDSIVDSKAKGI